MLRIQIDAAVRTKEGLCLTLSQEWHLTTVRGNA